MADTLTTNLNLTKPEPGAAEDTWGISLNADLDALDAIFSSSGTQINLNPNQVNFADNKKAVFGAGSDLQIYHDGSNSYIKDSGTGSLLIDATNLYLRNSSGEEYASFISDGAANLKYNGSTRIVTTSSGIDVTGVITQQTPANTDSVLTVDSTSTNVSQRLNLSANGTIQTQLYDDASQTKLSAVTNKPLILSTNNTERLRIDSSGRVGIGISSGLTYPLTVKSDAINSYIHFVNSTTGSAYTDGSQIGVPSG